MAICTCLMGADCKERERAAASKGGSCCKNTPVRHEGSPYCKSGSFASGGHRTHCTCDTCF